MSQSQVYNANLTRNVYLSAIKYTIIHQFDCGKSLSADFGVDCASLSDFGSIPLRTAGGDLLNPQNRMGEWTVEAKCNDDAIVFRATREGNDPLTGKEYKLLPEATDLFRGTLAGLCSKNFRPSTQKLYEFATASLETEKDRKTLDFKAFNNSGEKTSPVVYIESTKLKQLDPDSPLHKASVWTWVRGLACDQKQGYYLSGCNVAGFGDTDTLIIGNGCVTNDYDGHSKNDNLGSDYKHISIIF